MNVALGIGTLVIVHILIWFTLNLQFVDGWRESSKIWWVIIGLAIPTSILSALATKSLYAGLDSVWSARFIGFGTSYLVFPIMTWVLLGESMMTTKTISCIFLSILIVVIQLKF